jgi:hypothetical protein
VWGKLQESKAVQLITLARAGMAGGMGSHGDPGRWQRGGAPRQGGCSA